MRQSLVKQIRRTAKTLFPDRPYTEYTTKNTTTVLTDYCIKKLIKDTKRDLKYGRGTKRL